MNQRDMQHQVAVDGGASAIDWYSPAGEAPPPATRLPDLPPALLDDIACRVMLLGARSLLPLTCRAFSSARLLHVPALRIQLGRPRCDQLLTPRVIATLQARTSKLALTLWQPETEDSKCYTDLLAHTLPKLVNCAAVEVCKLVSSGTYDPYKCKHLRYSDKRRHLRCSPSLAQRLLNSFPSLTALALEGLCVSNDALASLLSHPPLALQLQQLDLTDTISLDGDEPRPLGPVFQGLQLKQLSLAAVHPDLQGTPPLPSFQPLAQHLTQLHLVKQCGCASNVGYFMECLHPLAQLQALTISDLWPNELESLTELLQALPLLHTLQLPAFEVWGEQQLDTLLAATQLTSLQLRGVRGLDASRADAPCSWQRLELTGDIKWTTIVHLPLHSLSQPLALGSLDISAEDIPDPVVAAALHRLAYVCKVPVKIKSMQSRTIKEVQLSMRSHRFITPPLLQQQRVDLAQLVSLLQPLRSCVAKVVVRDLHEVTGADVLALAPLCRDCTQFELEGGSMEPSLDFWHQLVQLMPTVQHVNFRDVRGCVCTAMHGCHDVIMAEQPWTRWLHVTLRDQYTASELPACWQSGSWLKAGILKVTMLGR
ncbi:hypothetical protein QJQ45_010923 [Haematococcus lacustris]|nr:hypothetical protein QJQ45_010923 [Haematococcus lacustris]